MNKTIHNALTGEVVISAMTQEEIAEIDLQAEALIAAQAAREAEAEAKAQAKAAAQTKLAALGLTTDDLEALGLGAN